MKEISLNHGKVTLVDDVDFDYLSRFKWRCYPKGYTFYVITDITIRTNTQRKFFMHRMILNPLPIFQIDHVNGNGLDNQRANLRIATGRLNQGNRRKNAKSFSKYKGVYWHKRDRHWRVQIGTNGKSHYVGSFKREDDAALAYNQAALKSFGSFAKLNNIP